MGFFNWLKSNEEEIGQDEDFITERLKEKKWIRVAFGIQLSNKKKFDNFIRIIEEETGWDAKEDYDKLKKKFTKGNKTNVRNFQVGGSFTTDEFLKLKDKILKAKQRLSKENKKPIWYITQTDMYTGEETNSENLECTAYDLIQAYDPIMLTNPLLSISFYLERLQEMNKKDKELVKNILGDYLEKIKINNAPYGVVLN